MACSVMMPVSSGGCASGGEVERLAAGHAADPGGARKAGDELEAALLRAGVLSPEARMSKASVSRLSPARMAVASSNARWTVGWPRLRSSSSIDGRSSWISE